MAENTDSGLTRPPDDRDLAALCRELNRVGAKYLVIGGVAINRLGFIRATEDLHLLIARDRAHRQLVRQAMEILPDKAIRELGEDADMADWVKIEGVSIPFANAELMLRFKQGWREKDGMDRRFLEERKCDGGK